MALCFKSFLVYSHTTSASNSALQATTVLVPDSGYQPSSCPGSVVLSATEYTDFLSNITNFGWDANAFNTAVQGGFMFFAFGLGVGLLISIVRKFRI